jgi:hypothetical protein
MEPFMKSKLVPFLLWAIAGAGCASAPPVPVVEGPPEARVTELASKEMNPSEIDFESQVTIFNHMQADLYVDRIDYSVDLFDKPLFSDSFNALKRTEGMGKQWVTFPWKVAMKDILAQSPQVLAEGQVRVRFRGTVYPRDSPPLPFEAEAAVPIPKPPLITWAGAAGLPILGGFSLKIGVQNPNAFPLNIYSLDAYVEMNGTRYPLTRTEESGDIPAGGFGDVEVHTSVKRAAENLFGMAINAAVNRSAHMAVGGSIRASTPYGDMVLPVRLDGDSH